MDDQTFLLDDMALFLRNYWLSIKDSADFEIKTTTKVHYAFTKQKNREEGTNISHTWSEHHIFCPVLTTIWQVMMHCKTFWRFDHPYNDTTKLVLYYTLTSKCVPLCPAQFRHN